MAKSFSLDQVGGLIFAPSEETRAKLKKRGMALVIGLDAWAAKGYPDNTVVYDFAGALTDLHVPILDAVFANGVYHRITSITPPKAARIAPLKLGSNELISFPKKDLVTISDSGILMVTEEAYRKATGRGKMSRGFSSRKAKSSTNKKGLTK